MSMGDKGTFLYRCRMCGTLEKNPYVPDVLLGLIRLANSEDFPRIWGETIPRIFKVHQCGDGLYGIADLVGGQRENSECLLP